jgi:hypothetical protein
VEIIDDMRQQTAVYWPPAGRDDYNRMAYGAPRELRVRWVDTTETVLNTKGQTKVSKSKVYVGEDVQEDGVLWPGKLADVPAERLADPLRGNFGAWEISAFKRVPDLDAEDFLRIAYL